MKIYIAVMDELYSPYEDIAYCATNELALLEIERYKRGVTKWDLVGKTFFVREQDVLE